MQQTGMAGRGRGGRRLAESLACHAPAASVRPRWAATHSPHIVRALASARSRSGLDRRRPEQHQNHHHHLHHLRWRRANKPRWRRAIRDRSWTDTARPQPTAQHSDIGCWAPRIRFCSFRSPVGPTRRGSCAPCGTARRLGSCFARRGPAKGIHLPTCACPCCSRRPPSAGFGDRPLRCKPRRSARPCGQTNHESEHSPSSPTRWGGGANPLCQLEPPGS